MSIDLNNIDTWDVKLKTDSTKDYEMWLDFEVDRPQLRIAGAKFLNKNWPVGGFFIEDGETELKLKDGSGENETKSIGLTGDANHEFATNVKIQTGSGEKYLIGSLDRGLYVDWGDGSDVEYFDSEGLVSHVYPDKDTEYVIKMHGRASLIRLGGSSAENNNRKIRDILTTVDNGVLGLTSAHHMFAMCSELSNITAGGWFDKASKNITDMTRMFLEAKLFNDDISNWDTGKVTTMTLMFYEAESFNRDIGSWNTGSVINMGAMFQRAKSFNQDIGNWDTGVVIDMTSMFSDAEVFYQDISGWCVEQIEEKPSGFDTNAGFENEDHLQPNWGEPC